jgi:hypothetical protein
MTGWAWDGLDWSGLWTGGHIPTKTNKTNKTYKSGVHAQGGLRRALCLGWRWAGVGLEQGWRGRILAHNLIVAGPRTGWAS